MKQCYHKSVQRFNTRLSGENDENNVEKQVVSQKRLKFQRFALFLHIRMCIDGAILL